MGRYATVLGLLVLSATACSQNLYVRSGHKALARAAHVRAQVTMRDGKVLWVEDGRLHADGSLLLPDGRVLLPNEVYQVSVTKHGMSALGGAVVGMGCGLLFTGLVVAPYRAENNPDGLGFLGEDQEADTIGAVAIVTGTILGVVIGSAVGRTETYTVGAPTELVHNVRLSVAPGPDGASVGLTLQF